MYNDMSLQDLQRFVNCVCIGCLKTGIHFQDKISKSVILLTLKVPGPSAGMGGSLTVTVA